MEFGDDVAQQGWRTGSVISEAMLPTLKPYLTRHGEQPASVSSGDWLVTASQTCDMVAKTLESEPLVEVLLCRPVPGKPRKGRRNLESTRYLDFRPNRLTHPKLVLTAHATIDRYLIPRALLRTNTPDPSRQLDDTASKRVLGWYALRAGRPSWPDKFCDRIRSAQGSLEDAIGSLTDDIAQVRVSIKEKDQDLGEGGPYHIAVFFVVDETVWGGKSGIRLAINTAFNEFVAALNECDGIEVDQELSDVVSGGDFTWQDTQQTDLWNFANLSQRD